MVKMQWWIYSYTLSREQLAVRLLTRTTMEQYTQMISFLAKLDTENATTAEKY